MIITLVFAWILTWFDLDKIIMDGINQILNKSYTTAVYWLIFFIVGLILFICSKIEE